MRVVLLAVLLACVSALLPATGRAALGDCTDPGYLGRFPEAPSAPDLLCVELFRVTVPSAGGERTIRGIQDVSADWAFAPGAPAAVERGARLAAAALPQLGEYRIDDVTLLLLDSGHATFWSGDRRPVLAATDGRAGSPETKGECLISLYMLGAGGDPEDVAITVAHEIFHCLQFATLTGGQMSTVGTGGDWWIEGSAEYFAALAVPDSLPTTDRSGRFDGAVEFGIALNGMAHEAVIFFYWLHGEEGPGALVPFMRKMAADGSAPAQHAVMRGALPDEDWLRFAEDYADRAIVHPQGALALSPPEGQTVVFAENGTQEFPLAPFVITLGNAEYECGRWRNTLSPEDANVGTREEDGTGWSDWPREVDARDAPPARYRIAALHTESAEATLAIEAERTVSCQPCGGSDRLDACLVGTWVMSGGGPGEWMRAMGMPITAFNSGPRVVTFHDDGAYGAEPVATSLRTETGDGSGEAEGAATVAMGRWSAADDTLAICQDSGGVSGTVTVTTRYGTMRGPVSAPGAGQLVQSYSCSDGSLSTSLPIPGAAPMETQYARVPGAEPGR